MGYSENQVRQWYKNLGLPFPEKKPNAKTSENGDGMNKTERRYSEHLESLKAAGEIVWFKFGCLSLKLAKATHYRPDFLVVMADGSIQIHEVKGAKKDANGNPGFYAREDSWLKIKIVSEMYPCFVFKIVFPAGRQWREKVIASLS